MFAPGGTKGLETERIV